jgi:glutamate 5-kinase
VTKLINGKLGAIGRVVVKAGTSSLTDENSRIDVGKVAKLVSEVMALRRDGKAVILVSSGAIGAGMGKIGLPRRPERVPQLQAAAAIGQGLLMQTYEFFFENYEQPIAQVLLTKNDFDNPERHHNLRMTLEALLEWEVIPIVNENDTVATEEIKVGDNDTLAAHVALGVEAGLLVILTDVDGLYTGNPSESHDNVLMRVVPEVTPEVESWASRRGRGFGGMYTKVQAAKQLALRGVPTVIVNSEEPNAIRKALDGHAGTLFLPNRGGSDE